MGRSVTETMSLAYVRTGHHGHVDALLRAEPSEEYVACSLTCDNPKRKVGRRRMRETGEEMPESLSDRENRRIKPKRKTGGRGV